MPEIITTLDPVLHLQLRRTAQQREVIQTRLLDIQDKLDTLLTVAGLDPRGDYRIEDDGRVYPANDTMVLGEPISMNRKARRAAKVKDGSSEQPASS